MITWVTDIKTDLKCIMDPDMALDSIWGPDYTMAPGDSTDHSDQYGSGGAL